MKKKLLLFFSKLLLLITVLILFFIGLVYIGGFGHMPTPKELKNIKQAQASIVYSADNVLLGKFYYKNRTHVSFNKLPKHLIDALIATEDVRFYEHKGIDKIAMLRVLVKTLILGNRSSGGGSTISQQLAKNLYTRKNFHVFSMPVNKTKEAILANRLENIYSKNEILTLYFNTVPFGERVYGIESAAQRYFSVPTQKLSLEQAAVLVGMLKANSSYNPRIHPKEAFQRRNIVLGQMKKANLISSKRYNRAIKTPLKTNYKNLLLDNPNGYFLQQVKKNASNVLKNYKKENGKSWELEKDGLIIETTLVSELQSTALKARKAHLIKLQKSMDKHWSSFQNKNSIKKIINQEWQKTNEYKYLKKSKANKQTVINTSRKKERKLIFNWSPTNKKYSKLDSINHYLKMVSAAIYGVETTSGAVQVYIGGNNYKYLPYNLITSERQVASTFKPFVYTAALENGQKPCDWIDNDLKSYTKYNNWKPQNYDHSEGGYYSMGGALAKSMNIPTVETYFNVGSSKLQQTVNSLGLQKELKEVPSTALGTTNYSLQNLVHAYIPFATRGVNVKPYYISKIKDSNGKIIYQHKKASSQKVTLEKRTLETMQLLLKGVVDKGTARKLNSTYKITSDWAGKTGTSQDYSDSWFIGFNSKFIIGSWVGCKYPSIHLPSNIGGGSVAALPIIGSVISKRYSNSKINRNLTAGFPKFSNGVLNDCDCPFYREENTIEKVIDLFDEKEEPKEVKKEKKRNFFSRLFGKKSK